MRQPLGFVLLHVTLVGVGFAALRAVGLIESPALTRRVWLWALGPAFLTGAALVVPCLIVGLVLGVPVTAWTTLIVSGAWLIASLIVHGRRPLGARSRADSPRPAERESAASALRTKLRAGWVLAAGVYAAAGALALASAPTRGDDARIWSLKGLTLAYYGQLQPAIFLEPQQAGGHAVYPLFQPALEAVLSRAMGQPELRFFHAELWLLFGAAIWTAGYLLLRTMGPSAVRARILSLAPLAALAAVPIAVGNIILGDADTTGSVMLAVGALAFGLWIETGRGGFLALAAVLLSASANTKDEDLLAALCVIFVGSLATILRPRAPGASTRRRIAQLGGLAAYFVLLVGPWRAWVAAHHLTDTVQPPLPHALDPLYWLHRTHQLSESTTAMLNQVLQKWDWLGAIFLVACLACLTTRTSRRAAWFYLASVASIVAMLLWLYTTTPLSLEFLLPTSMDRTVGVFMTLAVVATGHLLYLLSSEPGSSPTLTSP